MIALIFFLPLYNILGARTIFSPSLETWPQSVAYLFWVNIALAAFNLLPAFPMDGGRILRSFLAPRVGYLKATKIAVNFGHGFALLFGFVGLVHQPPHILLIIIAIFIYVAASNEETQVELKHVLKNFKVKDILPKKFLTLSPEATTAKVLETIFHSHQEDFPVVEKEKLVGFVTRQDIVLGIHKFGMDRKISEVMRRRFPVVKDTDSLVKVQKVMQANEIKALPVVKEGVTRGVINLEDISRVYSMLSSKR